MNDFKKAIGELSKVTAKVFKSGYDKALVDVCAWLEACADRDETQGNECTPLYLRDIATAIKNHETAPPPPPDVTLP